MRHANAARLEKTSQVDGGSLTGHIGVGGEDYFSVRSFFESLHERSDRELIWPDAVEWRESAMKDVVEAFVSSSVFQSKDVHRIFHHADLIAITMGIVTDLANGLIAEIGALLTV